MERFIPPTNDARIFVGGPATGKTSLLIEQAVALSEAGERSILALCATEIQKTALQNAFVAHSAPGVEVATYRSLALEALSDPAVIRSVGRKPHVLNTEEKRIFFEDMKTCGIKPRRLRELLAFLYRGWSDLADEDPDWLKTTEEARIVELSRDVLSFTGGMVEEEVANLAFKALRNNTAALARHARNHVLADDYCYMGRADQALVNLMASKSIAVFADDAAPAAVCVPYPYPKGLAEFQEANPHAHVHRLSACHRPAALVETLNNLRQDPALEGQELQAFGDENGEVVFCGEADFKGECLRIASLIEESIADGMSADKIAVVGVNPLWRRNIAQALATCGIPVILSESAAHREPAPRRTNQARPDQRDIEGPSNPPVAHKPHRISGELAATTLERIARDPQDAAAWRTWCSLGDHLGRSAAIATLRNAVGASETSLPKALALLAEGKVAGADPSSPLFSALVEAYRKGIELASAKSSGSSANEPEKPQAQTRRGVLVGSPQDLFGREMDVVVFGGFANGFIPSRDYFDPTTLVGEARARAHRNDVQNLYLCVRCARKRLIATCFTSCGLETAERLSLRISRTRLKNGIRICTIEPSELRIFLAIDAETNTGCAD